MVEAMVCPNCGAPLDTQGGQLQSICLYCNSLLRIVVKDELSHAHTERKIDEELMSQVKQLVLDGKSLEAAQLYQNEQCVDEGQAAQVIKDLGRQISLSVVRRQQLTSSGRAMVLFFAMLLAASILAGLNGWLSGWVAGLIALIAAFNLVYFTPALRATLRFRRAKIAPAITQKVVRVGVIRRRGADIYTIKALLEVKPDDGPPFQTELVLPVREQNLARAVPGEIIQVKVLPPQPGETQREVIFHEKVA
jgi:hypothetical protein